MGPLRGGPSFAVRTIAECLVNRGVSVDVVTTDDNGSGLLSVPLGQPVIENCATFWYFRRQLKFYTVSMPLFWWLESHVVAYDLVHIHSLFSFSATAGAFWAARRRVPYIVRPLGVLNDWGIQNRRPFLKKLSLRLIEQKMLTNAAVLHFTSEQERCEAESVAPAIKSMVIPLPVEGAVRDQKGTISITAKHPELAGRRVILFLSRLDPIKGLDLLLTGFAAVRKVLPDALLVIAGRGDDAFVDRLRAQSQRLGIQSDVIWAGFLEGETKRTAFAAAEILVLPSYSENFGIAVVEAMASGLPVIVSDKVAIHREVSGGNAGLVVHCDAGEVSEAIVRLLNDCEMRSRMARTPSFAPANSLLKLLLAG